MKFLEEKFVPLAAKVGSQKHLVAIRNGFVVAMPATIAGAIAVLLNNFAGVFGEKGLNMVAIQNGWNTVLQTTGLGQICKYVEAGTINVLTVLVLSMIAYNMAKANDGDAKATSVVALASYLAPASIISGELGKGLDVTVLKSTGLFVGMICALVIGEVFPRLSKMKALKITMPDGVPPAVANAFSSLLPAMISIFSWVTLCTLIEQFTKLTIWDLVTAIVSAPLTSISQSVFTVVLMYGMMCFLWTFGLHGSSIVGSVAYPVLTPISLENVAMFAAGKEPQYTVVGGLQSGFAFLGGSGATMGAIFAIFIFSKSKAQKAVASISVAPGIFEINEPLTFGLPIVMNPVYAIPFILGPILMGVITYFLMEAGWVRRPCIQVPWVTPPILIGFLCTGGDFRGAIWNAVELVLLTLLWTPFVMMHDKIEAKESLG